MHKQEEEEEEGGTREKVGEEMPDVNHSGKSGRWGGLVVEDEACESNGQFLLQHHPLPATSPLCLRSCKHLQSEKSHCQL